MTSQLVSDLVALREYRPQRKTLAGGTGHKSEIGNE